LPAVPVTAVGALGTPVEYVMTTEPSNCEPGLAKVSVPDGTPVSVSE